MAALLTGQSINEVARQFHLSKSTVSAWRQSAGVIGSNAFEPKKQSELGDLIADYLREALATLAAQARQFREPEWIKGQDASEVAVLHGVLADKAIRILAALEPIAE
jgi:transposase-like protein